MDKPVAAMLSWPWGSLSAMTLNVSSSSSETTMK
jgi:hypothetical protein